jgi:hypothetical protein
MAVHPVPQEEVKVHRTIQAGQKVVIGVTLGEQVSHIVFKERGI